MIHLYACTSHDRATLYLFASYQTYNNAEHIYFINDIIKLYFLKSTTRLKLLEGGLYTKVEQQCISRGHCKMVPVCRCSLKSDYILCGCIVI